MTARALLGAGPCVGTAPGCVLSIQAALDRARPGDAVTVGRGTFDGGFTIRKSVMLRGAGAGATIVRGGGPVVTIAPSAGRVSLARLTITGGSTTTDPARRCGRRHPRLRARLPPRHGPRRRRRDPARDPITDAVISGNRAEPRTTVPSVRAKCPTGARPFAQAGGGGIDNWGRLTLAYTTVAGNSAAGRLTAQADGGGILGEDGSSLKLDHSAVRGSVAAAVAPNGRLAAGGGIYVFRRGTLELRASTVSGNGAVLRSDYPDTVDDLNAGDGGAYVANAGSATVDHAVFNGNRVVVDAPTARAAGFDSALRVGASPLELTNSVSRGNSVDVTVGTSIEGGSGGALEVDTYAAISGVRVVGNGVRVTSASGRALAIAVVNTFVQGPRGGAFSDGVISGNSVSASSASGKAELQGAGLANNGPLELRNARVEHNTGRVSGPDGRAQGGGIFNGLVFHVPRPQLTLTNVHVSGNRLVASGGLPAQGAGLYTAAFHVRTERSTIAGNAPDQCFGC